MARFSNFLKEQKINPFDKKVVAQNVPDKQDVDTQLGLPMRAGKVPQVTFGLEVYCLFLLSLWL